MSDLQLFILYKQVQKEKSRKFEEKKDMFEYIFKNFQTLFDELQLFVDPKLFQKKMELREQKELLQETGDHVTVDNFDEVWEELMEVIPQEYVVEDAVDLSHPLFNAEEDKEFEQLLSGWIEKSNNFND